MLVSGVLSSCVWKKVIWFQTELSGQKTRHLIWDNLARLQKTARISKSTELKRKSNLVLRSTTCADEVNVFIGQRVMPEQRRLIRGKIKKCRALSRGQDRSVCHRSILSL
jgi:hypothetical protein